SSAASARASPPCSARPSPARCSASRSCTWAASNTRSSSPASWRGSWPPPCAAAPPPVPPPPPHAPPGPPAPRSWFRPFSAAVFGLIALLLIETMRALERSLRRWHDHPYLIAAGGGVALVTLYSVAGTAYAGLGTDVIESALAATAQVVALAFALKILATAIT